MKKYVILTAIEVLVIIIYLALDLIWHIEVPLYIILPIVMCTPGIVFAFTRKRDKQES